MSKNEFLLQGGGAIQNMCNVGSVEQSLLYGNFSDSAPDFSSTLLAIL